MSLMFLILEKAVETIKFRSCFDTLSTNGLCGTLLLGKQPVRPEQPAQRASRGVYRLATAGLRLIATRH